VIALGLRLHRIDLAEPSPTIETFTLSDAIGTSVRTLRVRNNWVVYTDGNSVGFFDLENQVEEILDATQVPVGLIGAIPAFDGTTAFLSGSYILAAVRRGRPEAALLGEFMSPRTPRRSCVRGAWQRGGGLRNGWCAAGIRWNRRETPRHVITELRDGARERATERLGDTLGSVRTRPAWQRSLEHESSFDERPAIVVQRVADRQSHGASAADFLEGRELDVERHSRAGNQPDDLAPLEKLLLERVSQIFTRLAAPKPILVIPELGRPRPERHALFEVRGSLDASDA
jgi:hypothetical protein